jgi:hypothetical protein
LRLGRIDDVQIELSAKAVKLGVTKEPGENGLSEDRRIGYTDGLTIGRPLDFRVFSALGGGVKVDILYPYDSWECIYEG